MYCEAGEEPGTLKGFVAKFRGPAFSVKEPQSYNMATSAPLPLPTTLYGALARALWLMGLCGAATGRSCVDRALALYATPVGPLDADGKGLPIGIANTFVLTRHRGVLEDGMSKEGKPPKKDAMLREYIYTAMPRGVTYALYVLPPCSSAEGLDEAVVLEALGLIDRLGDSESLVAVQYEDCTLERVRNRDEDSGEAWVNTAAPLTGAERGAQLVRDTADNIVIYYRLTGGGKGLGPLRAWVLPAARKSIGKAGGWTMMWEAAGISFYVGSRVVIASDDVFQCETEDGVLVRASLTVLEGIRVAAGEVLRGSL